MTKKEFSKVLVSRFVQMDDAARFLLIANLTNAMFADLSREEEKVMDEIAEDVAELLFPELIGEVKIRNLK